MLANPFNALAFCLVRSYGACMAEPRLIIKKRPRGEYEIGTYTDDGAIVARVSVREVAWPDTRTEEEKEAEALQRAKRLVRVLQEALGT